MWPYELSVARIDQAFFISHIGLLNPCFLVHHRGLLVAELVTELTGQEIARTKVRDESCRHRR